MPRKLRQLRADLRRAGFFLSRQRGSHQIWRDPDGELDDVILSGQDGDDAKPYQERDVQTVLRLILERKRSS
jgi:predicted RNA binding protein YcfA (HicA-like mRNA interferase family)